MKKSVFLAIVMIACVCFTANAQECHKQGQTCHHKCVYSPETKAMMKADELAAKLDLSDEVKAKLVTYYTEVEKENIKAREEFMAKKAQQDAELEKIIGPKKMKELKDSYKEQGSKNQNDKSKDKHQEDFHHHNAAKPMPLSKHEDHHKEDHHK